jgi:hypothetical protein
MHECLPILFHTLAPNSRLFCLCVRHLPFFRAVASVIQARLSLFLRVFVCAVRHSPFHHIIILGSHPPVTSWTSFIIRHSSTVRCMRLRIVSLLFPLLTTIPPLPVGLPASSTYAHGPLQLRLSSQHLRCIAVPLRHDHVALSQCSRL